MSLTDSQFMRYSRHLLMDDIGEQGQERLLNAHVLIVGMGGLGCPVSLYLAAAGIGQLSICDGDTVDASNLQRQVLYKTEDCGQLKVTEAVTLGSEPLEAHQFSLQFRAILLQCGAVEFEYGGCRAGCAGLVLCVCPLGG